MFPVRKHELAFRLFVSPKHFSRSFEGQFAPGLKSTVERLDLSLLAEIGDKIDGGIVIFLQALDDLIGASALRGEADRTPGRNPQTDYQCDREDGSKPQFF